MINDNIRHVMHCAFDVNIHLNHDDQNVLEPYLKYYLTFPTTTRNPTTQSQNPTHK